MEKIEKFDFATQFLRKQVKLHGSQTAFFPCCLWTEKTVKVTYIRYFKITTCNHIGPCV